MSEPVIIGDVSVTPRTRAPAGVDVRSGVDGRNRVIVPEGDRLALARALAGEGYAVVPVDPPHDVWARAIEAATIVHHRRLDEAGYPMWGAVVRAVIAVVNEGGVLTDGAVTVPAKPAGG